MYTAAVITVSDKGFAGEREDTGGPLVKEMLENAGYSVIHTEIIPDEMDMIEKALINAADNLDIALCVTTGGTGFSPRDITPEATEGVLERRTPGIPEAMRAESMRITPMGCLSRETAGIRGKTLIINLPGSKKASVENFSAVIRPVKHGIEILRGISHDCAAIHQGEHHHG